MVSLILQIRTEESHSDYDSQGGEGRRFDFVQEISKQTVMTAQPSPEFRNK